MINSEWDAPERLRALRFHPALRPNPTRRLRHGVIQGSSGDLALMKPSLSFGFICSRSYLSVNSAITIEGVMASPLSIYPLATVTEPVSGTSDSRLLHHPRL